MNDRKSLKGHVLSMLCVIAWGTSFLVSKNLMGRLTPVQLMLLRFVIAWLAIWLLYPKWHFNWREKGPFFVLSLVGNTLYYLAENTALRLTLVSNVSILVSAAPIASALMLRLFEHDKKLPRHQIVGIINPSSERTFSNEKSSGLDPIIIHTRNLPGIGTSSCHPVTIPQNTSTC